MNQNDFDFKNIRLIVGLGNVGDKFRKTRHNAGFIFLDLFSEFDFKEEKKFEAELVAIQMNKQKTLLAKPTTLMNNSGRTVNKLIKYFAITPDEILVVHDDLDIEIGESKLQFGKGPHGHNGILSIEQVLNTTKFWRLRLGIDNRTKDEKKNISGSDYVLGRFTTEEIKILTSSLKEEITEIIDEAR